MPQPPKQGAAPELGSAGSHQGQGLGPDDYEAMIKDTADGSLASILGVSEEEGARLEARISHQLEQSEQDISEASGTRVNFRWGREQVATVKRAADLAGVPYQTYIKLVAFRGAVADLQAVHALERNPAKPTATA